MLAFESVTVRVERELSFRKMALNCKLDHSDIKKYELGETGKGDDVVDVVTGQVLDSRMSCW